MMETHSEPPVTAMHRRSGTHAAAATFKRGILETIPRRIGKIVMLRGQARNANVLLLLRNERNCGRQTLEEIAHWLDDRNRQQ